MSVQLLCLINDAQALVHVNPFVSVQSKGALLLATRLPSSN